MSSRGRDYGRDSRGRDDVSMSNNPNSKVRLDEPPNSRLFILCQKGSNEQDFRDSFDKFGEIEDIWIIKDRKTNEDRGIVYIKFSKTSEAMRAMEEMNGKSLSGMTKGMKVVVANSKRDGSTRDPKEDERLNRLFVIVPKHFTESDLREEFSKFGELESVTVLKERSSGENKGFGYVRFFKPLHAALAFENCDFTFKPKFAEPQRSRDERDDHDGGGGHFHNMQHGFSGLGHKRNYEDDFGSGYGSSMDMPYQPQISSGGFSRKPQQASLLPLPTASSGCGTGPMDMLTEYPSNSSCSRLIIHTPMGLSQGYLSKLFDLIPGMEYCDLNEQTGVAYVRYNSSQCAAYAKDKLNGFEYPIGNALRVQYAEDSRTEFSGNMFGSKGSQSMTDPMDVRQQAFMLLEKAGINPHSLMQNMPGSSGGIAASGGFGGGSRKERTSYCSVPLPPVQPTMPDEGSNSVQRLFVVCQPAAVGDRVLKDAFCRFGNLIDVFLLSGRNYGYAKYTDKSSAQSAIDTLHGATLSGQRLKVFEAEPPKSQQSSSDEAPVKKQRL